MSDCIFCRIAAGELGSPVYRDQRVIVIDDINPQAPVHMLVIPIEHLPDARSLTDPDLLAHVFSVGHRMAAERQLDGGYRMVFNTGPMAGQTVFHVHLHVLGGRQMGWPPG